LKRTAKKCTKIYNAIAQPLFWSLNILFGDVLVAVAVMVFLNYLIVLRRRRFLMNNVLMTRRIRKIKAF